MEVDLFSFIGKLYVELVVARQERDDARREASRLMSEMATPKGPDVPD